jgi:hypothetical protein
MADYPSAIKTFTSKQDGIDLYLAAHINDLQGEVTAIETELGVNVSQRLYKTGDFAFTARSESSRTGWLLCDGSVVSRTTYASLFAVIGTGYNTGGEAGTDFRLPSFTDRFPRGNTITPSGGADTHNHGGATGGPSDTTQQSGGVNPIPSGSHTHTISSANNIPAYTGLKVWIKT